MLVVSEMGRYPNLLVYCNIYIYVMVFHYFDTILCCYLLTDVFFLPLGGTWPPVAWCIYCANRQEGVNKMQ